MIKLAAGTAVVLVVLWLLVINPTRASVQGKIKKQDELTQKIFLKHKTIKTADLIATKLKESGDQLEVVEDQMVKGDPYRWIINTLSQFEAPHKIEFSKYDPPRPVDELLPNKVPYKMVSFTVTGAATYHNLGNFLASLENTYAHVSVHRLDIEPVPGVDKSDEKLSFLLELYVPVKPVKGASVTKPAGS